MQASVTVGVCALSQQPFPVFLLTVSLLLSWGSAYAWAPVLSLGKYL